MSISFRTYHQGHKAGANDKRYGFPPMNFTAQDSIASRHYIDGYLDGYHGRAAQAPMPEAEGTEGAMRPSV